MDATNGTGYFKFEHDPWAYKADKKKFDDAKEKPVQPQMMNSKYNSFETYYDTKFKNGDSCKVKAGSNKVIETNFTMKNLNIQGCDDCCKLNKNFFDFLKLIFEIFYFFLFHKKINLI